jgi:hypothetical protein
LQFQQGNRHAYAHCRSSHILQQTRAGAHDIIEAKPIDVTAFSHSRKTSPVSPHDFLKKRTGNGGAVLVSD